MKLVPEAAIVGRGHSGQVVKVRVLIIVVAVARFPAQLLHQVLVQVLPVAFDGRPEGLVVERVILQLGVFVVVQAVFVALYQRRWGGYTKKGGRGSPRLNMYMY